jgi:2-polyprenyl-3-methyl-5-hydroxy-6-metoxy-1,4-benzoquinol methylase
MTNDVFMNVDALPDENIEVVAERLELRAKIEPFAKMRDRYFDAMALSPDARILELGGGTGPIGRAYVSRGDFSGCYVVSDLSQSLIDIGAAKAETEGLSAQMDFRIVDALTGAGLDDGDYDAVILHTVLSHVPEPGAVVRTAVSALRPGGIIVAFDADYASLQLISGDTELDERVEAAIKSNAVAQPTVMRMLPRLASGLGLQKVDMHPHFLAEVGQSEFFISLAEAICNLVVAHGGLSKEKADRWIATLHQAMEEDAFFAMCPYFTYLYRKP